MPVETPSLFTQVIQEHLELKRQNAELEGDMPLDELRDRGSVRQPSALQVRGAGASRGDDGRNGARDPVIAGRRIPGPARTRSDPESPCHGRRPLGPLPRLRLGRLAAWGSPPVPPRSESNPVRSARAGPRAFVSVRRPSGGRRRSPTPRVARRAPREPGRRVPLRIRSRPLPGFAWSADASPRSRAGAADVRRRLGRWMPHSRRGHRDESTQNRHDQVTPACAVRRYRRSQRDGGNGSPPRAGIGLLAAAGRRCRASAAGSAAALTSSAYPSFTVSIGAATTRRNRLSSAPASATCRRAAVEQHRRADDVVPGGDDDDGAPAVLGREPGESLRLAVGVVGVGAEAHDLCRGRPARAQPVRFGPLGVTSRPRRRAPARRPCGRAPGPPRAAARARRRGRQPRPPSRPDAAGRPDEQRGRGDRPAEGEAGQALQEPAEGSAGKAHGSLGVRRRPPQLLRPVLPLHQVARNPVWSPDESSLNVPATVWRVSRSSAAASTCSVAYAEPPGTGARARTSA